MKRSVFPLVFFLLPSTLALKADWAFPGDWLVDKVTSPVVLEDGTVNIGPPSTATPCSTVTLQNGLLARVFTTCEELGWTTWDITTAAHGSALRAISPEAILTLDNTTYFVGGSVPVESDGKTLCPAPQGLGPPGACPVAYMNRSQRYKANATAFQYVSHRALAPEPVFPWKPGSRHSRNKTAWPPEGLHLEVSFAAPATALPRHRGIKIVVHYELYKGAPIISKWITVLPPRPPLQQASDEASSSSNQSSVFIAPCGNSALGMQNWLLAGGRAASPQSFGSPIFLASKAAAGADADTLCLSAVDPLALDVLACPKNTADPHQLWTFNASTKSTLLFNTANTSLCADIQNHQSKEGAAVEMNVCKSSWKWVLRNPVASPQGIATRLESEKAPGQCLTFKQAGPTPPPPAPPLPADAVVVTSVVVETVRVHEQWAPTEPRPFDPFYGAGSDFSDGGSVSRGRGMTGFLYVHASQRHGSYVRWTDDPTFDPDYSGNIGANEAVLDVGYTAPSPFHVFKTCSSPAFESFRALMLYSDSAERERSGLGRRKLVRLLAPQSSEAPLFLHVTDTSPAGIRTAVDQMVAVGGFDLLIMSFGSGFQMENDDPAYLSQMRESIAYAHSHGIEVGGYDLIALSRTGTGFDTIDPTGKPSGSACFASKWADILSGKVEKFINATGLSSVETDGPYGGTPCSATNHEHHHDIRDSVQAQWKLQAAFYARMRTLGVYVHAPDDYFFEGGANKCALGYSEMQFNLPREEWLAISRAEVFDNTWNQIPTQGWMMVPLVPYHGSVVPGAAQLEPLSQHIIDWEWTLATFIGAGVGACYRGVRLFDTPAVETMVKKWTKFWLRYRRILTEDIIHVRRPTMSEIDCILHVSSVHHNPEDNVAALAMVYNPTDEAVDTTLTLPLYYAGLRGFASIAEGEGQGVKTPLNFQAGATIKVALQPRAITYFVVKAVAASTEHGNVPPAVAYI